MSKKFKQKKLNYYDYQLLMESATYLNISYKNQLYLHLFFR